MAYSARYSTEFSTILGDRYRVQILKRNYTGGVEMMTLMGVNPVIVKQDSSDGVVVGTICTIRIKSDSLLRYMPVVQAPENDYMIELATVAGSTYTPIFSGFINPELFEENYNGNVFRGVSISASCGLSTLEHRYLTVNELLQKTLINWVRDCLSKVGIDYNHINVVCQLIEEASGALSVARTLFDQTSAWSDNFILEQSPRNCREVLTRILGAFNCSIFREGDHYWIERHRDRMNDTGTRWVVKYPATGLQTGANSYTPVYTIGTDLKLIDDGQYVRVSAGKKIVAAERYQYNLPNLIRISGLSVQVPFPPAYYFGLSFPFAWGRTTGMTLEMLSFDNLRVEVANEPYNCDGLTTGFYFYTPGGVVGGSRPPQNAVDGVMRVTIKAKPGDYRHKYVSLVDGDDYGGRNRPRNSSPYPYGNNGRLVMGLIMGVVEDGAVEQFIYHENNNENNINNKSVSEVGISGFDPKMPMSTSSVVYYPPENPPDSEGFYKFEWEYKWEDLVDYGLVAGRNELLMTIRPMHLRNGDPTSNQNSSGGANFMGDCLSLFTIKEIKVAAEIEPLDNYFEVESPEGYREQETHELYFHDGDNLMVASNLLNADGGGTQLWHQRGETAEADMTTWFLHDKFQQVYKPTYGMEATVKRQGLLPWNALIHDAVLDKHYFMKARVWNVKNNNHRLTLQEYINEHPDLDDI